MSSELANPDDLRRMPSGLTNPDDLQSQIDPRILGPANLNFFLNDRLLPILQEVEAIGSYPEKQSNFVRAELLESFLWLHLGVQIEYFPLPLSRRAIYEYFPMILKAYEVISHTPFFETAFAPPLRAIWASEFTGRQELFSSARIWKEAPPPDTSSVFQSSSIFANEFVQDLEARPFVQAITFSTDSEWEQALKGNKSPSDVEKNELSDHLSPDAHWASPGVFSAVDYLRTLRQLKFSAQEQNSSKEFAAFRQRLTEIQQWRLNFANEIYRTRFQSAAQAVAEHVRKQHSIEQWKLELFAGEIYDLMTDLGAPPKHMGARSAD
jgi:hypothetical protein